MMNLQNTLQNIGKRSQTAIQSLQRKKESLQPIRKGQPIRYGETTSQYPKKSSVTPKDSLLPLLCLSLWYLKHSSMQQERSCTAHR